MSDVGCFEDLPDEILLDLFENYIRLYDIYHGFHFLNHNRINRVLRSAQFNIDIPSKDIFHLQAFTHFSHQITSLHLSTFCDDLDLLKLPNLRFLHIEKPTRPQVLSIRAEYLPKLIYLSLISCWFPLDELPRYVVNLSHICPFKYLRLCILPNGKSVKLSSKQNVLITYT